MAGKSTKATTSRAGSRSQSDFVEYLLSFYGKDGIYGPKNRDPIFRRAMSRKEAVLAANIVGAAKDYEGDTFDREKARDLVLSWRGHSTKSHAIKKAAKNYLVVVPTTDGPRFVGRDRPGGHRTLFRGAAKRYTLPEAAARAARTKGAFTLRDDEDFVYDGINVTAGTGDIELGGMEFVGLEKK